MKLQVLQTELSKALTTALRFTSSRGTLPLLSNFLLTAEKTKLRIESTNLEMSVSISIGAKVEKEGSSTVLAKTFMELVANLNQDQIELNLEKDQLGVVCRNFKGSLPTVPPNDFPKVPGEIDTKKSFSIQAMQLKEALSKVLFSVSSDETRPILTGVLFIFNENVLNLVSSDGFRLSQKTLTLSKKLTIPQIVIPKYSLLELIKISGTENQTELNFELKGEENQLIVKIGEVIVSTRLIEGSFPDFKKIIPANSTTKVNIDRDDLSRGVKLSSVFAREGANVIKLKVKENSIEIQSESEKAGKEVDEIEAKVEGGTLDISYNYKFVEEFLGVTEGSDVEIKLTDGNSPAIFVDTKDKDFLHLIMPVRIQN